MLPPTTPASTPRNKERTIPLFVCACVLLSLGTVALSPWVMETELYLTNLLVMHGLLILPFLPIRLNKSSSRVGPAEMFTIVMSVSGALRLLTTARMAAASSGAIPPVWSFLHEHPAKSSIGWDILWTTVSMLVWRWTQEGAQWMSVSIPLIALSSIGTVTSGWLAFDEIAVEMKQEAEGKEKEKEKEKARRLE
ncbi:hypothetical protein FRB96_006139 [Tulasnella sp. 330]|nr:hypothetical protein FRB96_006139 [Tulasnella sp. 330]